MFEATTQFFHDAYDRKLGSTKMLDILLTMTGIDDTMPLGQAALEFSQLLPEQRDRICRVLLERDQAEIGWQDAWDNLESEAFE